MADFSAVYRDKSPSWETKTALVCLHLGIVAVVVWLLVGGGIGVVDGWLGRPPELASVVRRGMLVGAAGLYFLLTLATIFVFMKRRMPPSEVVTIAVWIGAIDLLFAYFGGRNPAPFGVVGAIGAGLVLVGSAINTGSEWQRQRWKRDPDHAGRLYTGGLLGYARHINYFGDLVLFTGWALMTGRAGLLVIPAIMVGGFVLVNIPAQDRYLAERYGEEYREYAQRVKQLVPFIY
jgi:protein-S-isoprenylcysteine O-methyltransferase Ste14